MIVRLALIAVLIAVLSVGLGGCGGSGDGATGPDGVGPSDLDGRTFVATTLTNVDPVAGTTISISFDDGDLGVEAGCNRQGGRYSIDDGLLVVEDLFTTEIGCDQALHAQDQLLADFVTSRPTVRLAGDMLTLSDGTVTIEATDRAVVDPDVPIVGTRWVLDSIIDGEAVSSVPGGFEAFVEIDDDGNLSLFDGCNAGSGPVEVGDGELRLGAVASTRMACEGETEQLVSDAFGRVLASGTAVGFDIEVDRLTISTDDHGLVFRAAG